jgi:Arc/MetJ-type ribon-helix-helix transcriptional regulator
LAKDRLRSEYTIKDILVVELQEELVDKIDKLVNEAGGFKNR